METSKKKKRKLNTEDASGFESEWNFDEDEIEYDDGGENEDFNEKVRKFFDESDSSNDSETESTNRNVDESHGNDHKSSKNALQNFLKAPINQQTR